MNDNRFAEYDAKCARAAELNVEILPHNKQVLFEALAAVGITAVTIDFDGYGDSGSFQEAAAFDANSAEIALPTVDMTIKTVVFDTGVLAEEVTTPRDYIESLVGEFLEHTHSGWEDGEGAYGQFRFSLAERTITLEYSERYVDTHYHEHEF